MAFRLTLGMGLLLATGIAVAQDNVLVRRLQADPASVDPHLGYSTAEAMVVHDLFEGLITFDAHGQPVPGVAESWEVSNDGLVYRFRIRDELKWSDGTPLTAQDFVYSFRRLLDPATASPGAEVLYPISNARRVNSAEAEIESLGVRSNGVNLLEITLENPTAHFLRLLVNAATMPVPQHVIEAHGPGWTGGGVMVSNGAYQLVERLPNNKVELRLNPEYRNAGDVEIRRVRYIPVLDHDVALTRFRAGEFHVSGFSMSKTQWALENLPGEARLEPYLGVTYVVANTGHPILANHEIRCALSMLIDREVIVGKLRRMGEQAAYSFVPPGIEDYRAARPEFSGWPATERIRRARGILEEAGYTADNPMVLELKYASSGSWNKIALAVATMWRQGNVQTRLHNMEGRAMYAQLGLADFDVALSAWIPDYSDPMAFLDILRSESPMNFFHYDSPAFDAALRLASAEQQPDQRNRFLHAAEAEVAARCPVMPIFFGSNRALVSDSIDGWRQSSTLKNLSQYLSFRD